MRRLALGALIAFALCIGSAVPAFADDAKKPDNDAKLLVTCSLDKGTQIDLHGTLVVPNKSSGAVDVWLLGRKGGGAWTSTGMVAHVNVVMGQTSYSFLFNANLDSAHFNQYRLSGDGVLSRVIDRDECGFRVPEAPASSLLLLGGIPAGALIAVKALGVRLPRPSFRRIA